MSIDVLLVTNRPQRSTLLSAGLQGYGFQVRAVSTLENAAHYLDTDESPAVILLDTMQDPAQIKMFIRFVERHVGSSVITIGYDDCDGCTSLPRRAPVDVVIQSVHIAIAKRV